MAKIPFSELDIRPQSRKRVKKRIKRENIGVDTETYQGKVRLICDSFGRILYPSSPEDLLQFLIYKKYRNAYCWFWNLRYDFESILKWLPVDNLREIYFAGKTTWEGYTLKYLEGKYFEVSVHKNKSRFYDMANFLVTSLDNAATTYLGEGKMQGVDGNLLNTDENYWSLHKKTIEKYCVRDAVLTKRLADFFWYDLIYPSLQIYPMHPYSKGSFSQEYFLEKCFVPIIKDLHPDVLEFAYNSYYGGRFELLQRGYFKNVYIYDLKSAYPSVIAHLPDFTKGKWFYTDEFNPDNLHAFYQCRVTAMNPVLSPFMQKLFNLNCYCNGEFSPIFLTGHELNYIRTRFRGSFIQVYDGWYWEPGGPILHPFYDEVVRLYQWKETEGKEEVRYAIKTVLNAIYGKFIQTVGGHTGKLFNPLYAAECSALTRIKLLEAAREVGFNHVISFSTDAVHTTVPFTPSHVREDYLGEFVQDFHGQGVYILSDIYTCWNDSEEKARFRGRQMTFDEQDEKKHTINVRDIITEMAKGKVQKLEKCWTLNKDGPQQVFKVKWVTPTKFHYIVRRPVHLGEALIRTGQGTGINIFKDEERWVDINGDKKRAWTPRKFLGADEVLERHHVSEPLLL